MSRTFAGFRLNSWAYRQISTTGAKWNGFVSGGWARFVLNVDWLESAKYWTIRNEKVIFFANCDFLVVVSFQFFPNIFKSPTDFIQNSGGFFHLILFTFFDIFKSIALYCTYAFFVGWARVTDVICCASLIPIAIDCSARDCHQQQKNLWALNRHPSRPASNKR